MWAWTYNPMPEIHWLNNPFRHKGFPGIPLFCKFNEHDGLVGILLSNDVGGSKGYASEFTHTQKELIWIYTSNLFLSLFEKSIFLS